MSQTPGGTWTAAWQGATTVHAGHYGLRSDGQPIEVGINGPYEHLEPGAWPGWRGDDYRRCSSSVSWVGEALVLHLLQAESAFGAEIAASGEMVVVAAAPLSETIPPWIFPHGAR